LERKEFYIHLKDYLLMLERARHRVPTPEDLKLAYADSYVACEHLTYVAKTNEDTFEIRMDIPALQYDYLIVELKTRYSQVASDIHRIPIVQGYMFETAFLSSKHLRENLLTIQAINTPTCWKRLCRLSAKTVRVRGEPSCQQKRGSGQKPLNTGYRHIAITG
jgi:hypothetical protein